MSGPIPRVFASDPRGDGGSYFSVEQFFNELTVKLLNSNTVKALAVAVLDTSGNQITPVGLPTSIGDGRKTVTTAGTRLQLSSSSVPCKRVTIQALKANTGEIVVGGITVVASAGTRQGIAINALDTIELQISDLNLVYLDSTVNGEGVSYTYEA